MRISNKSRKTKETEIELNINIDGSGKYNISTDFNFFNHMLEQFSYHSGIDIELSAKSLDSDPHHLVEDTAIILGQAINEAIGDKRGIKRYSNIILPMDETLILCAIDISGRPYCRVNVDLKDERVSDFETVLLSHFFNSLAQNLGMALHIKMLDGFDTHHIIEASFKASARALKSALEIDLNKMGEIPSTKGVL